MVLWGFRNLYEARKTACLDVHQCVWAVLTLLCHIYKITTWWGVSVCKKMQSKTKQTNKKIRQQEAISLAGDQLIMSSDWRASARRIVANRSERCFNWAGPHQRGGNCSGSWQQKVYFLDDAWGDTVYRRALLLEYDVISSKITKTRNISSQPDLELRPTEGT